MVLLHRIGGCLVALVIALPFGCASGQRHADRITASFSDVQRTLAMSDGRAYDAILSVPHGEPIALAVLFGGGSVTDAHWTVPAVIEIEGQSIAMTIGGVATRDADAIARAMLERGIAVYRFSSIHREDPMASANPGMAMGIPYPDARAIACAALADAESIPEFERLPVFCIGHSLGAARSLQCAASDPRIAGFVFLAGAYLTNPRDNPSRIEQGLVDAALAESVDLDRGALPEDWRRARTALPESVRDAAFADVDLDGDGAVRRWEIAAALHLAMLDAGDTSFRHARTELAGGPLPSELVLQLRKPTLAIFGGLDPMSYHGPMLVRAAEKQADPLRLSVEYWPNVGHNLGPQAHRIGGHAALAGPFLTGPINHGVCARIAEFVAEIARR